MQRSIATDYIINNFPKTLSQSRIKEIIAAYPVNASSLSEIESKLCSLLATQKKSESIENYFKQIISYNSSNSIAWHYLLREDVAVDLSYVFFVIKAKPNYYNSYSNIVQYAMDIEDGRVCTELLNSHDVVDFLITNIDAKTYLKQSYDWINMLIERRPSYKRYKNTYFFKAVEQSKLN